MSVAPFDIPSLIETGLGIINKFIPDKAAQDAAAAEYKIAVLTASDKADADQRSINQVEAGNASMFVAGWRPACGWLCVGTLAYSWIAAPLVSWGVGLVAHVPNLPVLGDGASQILLYALLGLGGYRSFDKVKGTATAGIAGR